VVRSARKPEADTLQPIDDPVRQAALWDPVKPIYAIIAAKPAYVIIAAASVLLVLLLAAVLLLRSGSAHKPPPASRVPSIVTPLPQSPAPVATPEPTEARPVEDGPGGPDVKRSKKLDGIGGRKKPNPFGSDSLEDSPRPKPKAKAKKKLYEDL
jgi:hypothetical protein